MNKEQEQSDSYIDKEGKVWTNLGHGISITNYDGSPFIPIDWDNLGRDSKRGENLEGPESSL
jgi:hypothetical protein